jgi:hypothetical protein
MVHIPYSPRTLEADVREDSQLEVDDIFDEIH